MSCCANPVGTHFILRILSFRLTVLSCIGRRQVSPREEEINCKGENTEEEDEVVETVYEALANMRRTTRTGKTYSPRKKGQKKKRGVTEDEDEESKQSDENVTPMR